MLRAPDELGAQTMELNQVKAVITGGASGLGFAVAERLVREGARVALLDVQDDKGAAAVAQLGANARYLRTDVTHEDGVAGSISAAAQAMDGLNAVINCAGILGAGRVLGKQGAMPLSQFETTIRVNLIGSFNVAKAGAHWMQNNAAGADGERGVIINTASVAAFDGQIGQIAYAASKGGVVAMALPAARDLSIVGIRVLTIAPGTFNTPMMSILPEPARQALAAGIPYPRRLGDPNEYAALAQSIVENRYLNGEVIRLDGALRMPPK